MGPEEAPSPTPLFDAPLRGDRDGGTFDKGKDAPRLNAQAEDVFEVMKDGRWRSLAQITSRTGHPEASVSARLRDLRKPRFGGYNVQRQREKNGLYVYRLLLPHGADD